MTARISRFVMPGLDPGISLRRARCQPVGMAGHQGVYARLDGLGPAMTESGAAA